MDALIAQANTASPFIASFCLLVGPGVILLLWRHVLFLNAEHRKTEMAFATSMLQMAKSVQKLASSVERPRRGARGR